MPVTQHFIDRAAERLGYCRTDAIHLAEHLVRALQRESDDLEYIGRVNRAGVRLFRFHTAESRCFYVLLNTETLVCITVLPPGYTVSCEGKGPVHLKETDI